METIVRIGLPTIFLFGRFAKSTFRELRETDIGGTAGIAPERVICKLWEAFLTPISNRIKVSSCARPDVGVEDPSYDEFLGKAALWWCDARRCRPFATIGVGLY